MAPRYLNAFHKQYSLACRRDLVAAAQRPLSVKDVLEQSRRFGRDGARVLEIPNQVRDEGEKGPG